MEARVVVHIEGPILEGLGPSIVDAWLDDVEQHIAQLTENEIQQHLSGVLREPTGFFQSNITSERMHDGWSVHDNDVVYGGWLEGVDERNFTTEFPGYHTFRIVTERIERQATTLAQQMLPQLVSRLDGQL